MSFSGSDGFVTVSKLKLFLMGPPPSFPINKPYGVAMRDGAIYLCDTGYSRLLKADFKTKRFDHVITTGGGGLLKPINIEFDKDGTLYVADPLRGQVVVYDKSGACTGYIGKLKEMRPTDVALSENRIFVSDQKKHVLDVFNKADKEFLFSIPKEGSGEDAALYQPANIALSPDNKRLYVSDAGGFNIKEYDLDGNYVKTISQHGDTPGQLARPKGITVDREGRIYIVDAVSEVVQVFNKEGALLMYFGQPGSPSHLILPADVTLNYDDVELFSEYIDPDFDVEYLVIVTSQFGPHKVSVFGFGEKRQ